MYVCVCVCICVCVRECVHVCVRVIHTLHALFTPTRRFTTSSLPHPPTRTHPHPPQHIQAHTLDILSTYRHVHTRTWTHTHNTYTPQKKSKLQHAPVAPSLVECCAAAAAIVMSPFDANAAAAERGTRCQSHRALRRCHQSPCLQVCVCVCVCV
jgi:hypothetical protein